MDVAVPIIIVAIVSFLLGSIPFGLVISKTVYKRDLREVGSGNIGTTNAIRAVGKLGGYVVFLLDFGKGILSGVIALAVAKRSISLLTVSRFFSQEEESLQIRASTIS